MEGRVGEGHTSVLHAMREANVLAAPNWFLASSFFVGYLGFAFLLRKITVV